MHLKEGGVLIFASLNRKSLARKLADRSGKGWSFPAGPSWSQETHRLFAESLGLKSVWSCYTPVTWTSITESLGVMPPLRIQPPDLNGITILLTGEDLALPVRNYLNPVLHELAPLNGRFFLSAAVRSSAE